MKNKKNALLTLAVLVMISLLSTAVLARGNNNGMGQSGRGGIQGPQKNTKLLCDQNQDGMGRFGRGTIQGPQRDAKLLCDQNQDKNSRRQKSMKGSNGSKMHKGKKGGSRDGMRKYQAEFRTWLEKNYPQEFKSVTDAKSRSDMQAVTRRYMPIFMAEKRGHSDMAELLKKDLDLKDQRDALVKEINATDDTTAKAALIKELSTVVSKRFDIVVSKKKVRYNNLKKRITELEKEVEKQEVALDKLESNKDAEVKQRLKELVEPEVKLEW